MIYLRKLVGLWFALALGACVTVNVYFPAAAAEKAADKIIEEVWGRDLPSRSGEGESEPNNRSDKEPSAALLRFLALLVPAAHAAEPDIDISSPAIQKIEASMRARHEALARFYDGGAAGLTSDGLVAVRDPRAVPLSQRRRLSELVAEENRDRKALYREIAQANGHPEWESNIRATFARRWVSKARRGWWYQTASGWSQK